MTRSLLPRAALLAGVLLACAPPAAAQLRPLDPFDWTMLEPGRTVAVRAGAGHFADQRASIAGTEGRLREWGNLAAHWRTGRVVFEAGGTLRRTFRDERRFAEPAWNARTPADGRRGDAGDYRIASVVRLTPERLPPVILRFGTRLPTTDDLVGLDRDQTDFYALLGARLTSGAAALAAESGVGIHGARSPTFEQADVMLYNVVASYRLGPVEPRLVLLGQWSGPADWVVRGNEDLQELRLGARLGTRRWLEVDVVRGTAEFSPSFGVLLSAGMAW